MKTIIASFNNLRCTKEITLAIGNFDGVHLGHQSLIKKVLEFKDTYSALMSFNPHPSTLFSGQEVPFLMHLDDKIAIIEGFGIDYLFIVDFNWAFAEISKDDFILFLKKLHVKRLILGSDFRFGKNREGYLEDLKKDFLVEVVTDIRLNDTKISSSLIRNSLMNGDLNRANEFLSRPYLIKGTVVSGNKIGRTLGFPTANIDFLNYLLPQNGVYATLITIQNQKYLSMTNIGNNPTINYSKDKKVEVHIFDFNSDIYGEKVQLEFLGFIREEIKFTSREELIAALKANLKYIKTNY